MGLPLPGWAHRDTPLQAVQGAAAALAMQANAMACNSRLLSSAELRSVTFGQAGSCWR